MSSIFHWKYRSKTKYCWIFQKLFDFVRTASNPLPVAFYPRRIINFPSDNYWFFIHRLREEKKLFLIGKVSLSHFSSKFLLYNQINSVSVSIGLVILLSICPHFSSFPNWFAYFLHPIWWNPQGKVKQSEYQIDFVSQCSFWMSWEFQLK